MNDIDEAISALAAGAYPQADGILTALGAGKPAAAARTRILWAITQVLCRKFGDGVEAILEVADRAPNRDESIYRMVLSAVGPLESLLSAEAAQEVRLRIGDYFLREEKAEEARAWLAAAFAADREDPLAIYLEANCRFALYGERQAVCDMEIVLERAAAESDRAYFIAGGTAALWYRLGIAHDRLRNLEVAAEYLADAVAIDPENDSQRLLLGDVLIRLGRFGAAIELLSPIPKFADNYRYAARLRAVALYRIGETEEALALLEEVAEIDPLGALTFLEMGRVYLERGDAERAELALARAFRTNPELPGLKSAIGTLERQLGRHMDADAGLPDPQDFAVPEAFAPRLDDAALLQRASLIAGIASHLRVLRAIILRDMLIRYEHSGIGYMWALVQPLVYIAILDAIYNIIGHPPVIGNSNLQFLISGLLPLLCFYIRVESAVSGSIMENVNLLYFREVTPLAMIFANWLREYLTSLVVFVIIVGGLALYDGSLEMSDPLTVILALTAMSVIGMVIGTFFGLGRLVIPGLDLAETVIFRLMFFFSGALFVGNMIPPRLRYWALFNPVFHLIEFVRNGYFTTYHDSYVDWHYPLTCIGVGLVLMMATLHAVRRRVVAP